MTSSTWRIYVLLFFLILAWAWNIVFTKIGLEYIPPLWLTFLRIFIGTLATFVTLALTKQLNFPRKADWPFVITIGTLLMGIFQLLFNYGMLYVHAGRSSILTYATPLWVAPLAIIFFKEKLTVLKLLGIGLGILGIVLLFSPHSFDWSDPKIVLGNGFLLGASLCWAIGILYTRYRTWYSPPLVLLPWQLLIASIITFAFAFPNEPISEVHLNLISISIVLFSGLIATALGYWISISVSKALPAITTSLAFLCVPILTLIFSAMVLGEPLTFTNVTAAILIIGGLTCISFQNRKI